MSNVASLEQRATDLEIGPHSMEAEMSVLGGIMLANEALADVADVVDAEDFFAGKHRVIYRNMLAMEMARQPMDVVTLRERLESTGETDDAGGPGYLISLAKDCPSVANIRRYAEIVRDKAVLRRLMDAGEQIRRMSAGDAWEAVERAQGLVLDIGEPKGGEGPCRVSEMLRDWIDDLDRRNEAGDSMVGISTGFADEDAMLHGMERGAVHWLGGRPGMGKTTKAMGTAKQAAIRGETVLVFSLEMSKEALLTRLIADEAGVQYEKVRTAQLSEEEWPRVSAATIRVSEWPLFIDDTPGLTVLEMQARARRLKRKHGMDLIVVDYLGLITASGSSLNERMTEISKGIKAMAKRIYAPVLGLVQLNRDCERRPDKRPIPSDLRDSGSLEQDADVIEFLYRDDAYHDDPILPGVAELIIGKQRNGRVGTVLLTFQGEMSRFANCDRETQKEYWQRKGNRSRKKTDTSMEGF